MRIRNKWSDNTYTFVATDVNPVNELWTGRTQLARPYGAFKFVESAFPALQAGLSHFGITARRDPPSVTLLLYAPRIHGTPFRPSPGQRRE